jgi:hypothetical protein
LSKLLGKLLILSTEEVVLLLMENHVGNQEDELLMANITGLDQLVPSIGLTDILQTRSGWEAYIDSMNLTLQFRTI